MTLVLIVSHGQRSNFFVREQEDFVKGHGRGQQNVACAVVFDKAFGT